MAAAVAERQKDREPQLHRGSGDYVQMIFAATSAVVQVGRPMAAVRQWSQTGRPVREACDEKAAAGRPVGGRWEGARRGARGGGYWAGASGGRPGLGEGRGGGQRVAAAGRGRGRVAARACGLVGVVGVGGWVWMRTALSAEA